MAHSLSQQEFVALNRGAVSPLTSARIIPPLVALGVAALSAWLLSLVISDTNSNPVAVLLLISGIISIFYALMRPWNSLIIFIWLAVTIDAIKRLTYALSDMNFFDVAQILVVPVLLMGGIYLRIIFLHWFAARHEITKVDLRKFWPIILLSVIATGGLLIKNGGSFNTIASNYQLLCYIPAAIAVPHMLNSTMRWRAFSRSLVWITLVIGVYGLAQVLHGPFNYEMDYLLSGLTSTINLIEEEYFRAFSLLNTSATFAGMMMIGSFFSLYALCEKEGRLRLKTSVAALLLFSAVACFGATQRGAFFSGLLVMALLPLFARPGLLKGLMVGALFLYVLIIVYAEQIKESMGILEVALEPLRFNDFMRQNLHVLTLGQRLDGMMALTQPGAWTLFGGGDVGGGHNLLVDMLGWTGAVGLTLFMAMVFTVLHFSLRTLVRLKHNPRVFLWAQVNLAVFLYIIVWSMLLGSVIHVSPMNFFFWLSVGNLIFIANTPSTNLEDDTEVVEEEEPDEDQPRLVLSPERRLPVPQREGPPPDVILHGQ